MKNIEEQNVEESVVFALQGLNEIFYSRFCDGEITVEQLQSAYDEMRNFSKQAERILGRLTTNVQLLGDPYMKIDPSRLAEFVEVGKRHGVRPGDSVSVDSLEKLERYDAYVDTHFGELPGATREQKLAFVAERALLGFIDIG